MTNLNRDDVETIFKTKTQQFIKNTASCSDWVFDDDTKR